MDHSHANTPTLSIVAACNDDPCLEANLMASPLVQAGLQSGQVDLWVARGAPSAAQAYNEGIDKTKGDYILFVHQDVYMPPGFEAALTRAITQVSEIDPDWAIIAPFGMDQQGRHCGHVWSTSQGGVLGGPMAHPVAVQSIDELLIVMRRDAGLRFDPALPLYHMYGTDIVQTAWQAGRGAYVADLPLVHNDKFHGRLGADFTACYHFMRRKWRAALPLRSPVLRLSRHGLDLPLYRLRARRSYADRQARSLDPATDPRIFSRKAGWETS